MIINTVISEFFSFAQTVKCTFETIYLNISGPVFAFSVSLFTNRDVNSNPIIFDIVRADTHDMYK